MSELPSLHGFEEKTAKILQKVSHLVKELQRATLKPKQLSLEHSVQIYPKGIYGQIGDDGNLYYNFAQGKLSFKQNNNIIFKVLTENKNLDSLRISLLEEFSNLGIELNPDLTEISGTEKLEFDNAVAKDYALILWKLYSALARVKSSLFGTTSPLVLWSHHFDFAFLYFPTEKLTEQDPTIAFGFAPYSDGINRPYAYMYAWDGKAYVKLDPDELMDSVNWWDQGWQGTVLKYDDLLLQEHPIKYFEDYFKEVFGKFKEKIGYG